MRQTLFRPIRPVLVTGLLLWAGLALAAPQPEPIEIGVLPTLSARTTITTYQPLRAYLEEQLKRPVVLVTAPDYRTFVERTQRGEYRYVVTAPHFARLAQTATGYQPLVRVKRELQALLVTDPTTGVTDVAGLRGKVVTTPDSLAVISMLGAELLGAHGLLPDRDVTLRAMPSFSSAVIAMRNGESAAAVTAATALNQMPADTRARLTTLATTKSIPHVMCLAGPKVPAAESAEVARLLLAFADSGAAGNDFFATTGFVAFTRTSEAELRSLDVYVAELKKRLAAR
jgi:phosphonate transport system substrate-binding protein